jgi:uncharacterized protein (DUF2164 family)
MKIELKPETRADAIDSIQRYFEENMPEPLGNLPAAKLLDFFLEELGPVAYNRAIADVQARMAVRISDLSGELSLDELQYWPKEDARRGKRRR